MLLRFAVPAASWIVFCMRGSSLIQHKRCVAVFVMALLGGMYGTRLVAQQPATQTQSNPTTQQAPPSTGEATKTEATDASGGDTLVRLGAGDLVEVGVYDVPELNTKARVASNGDLYLPLISYVHVSGLTPEEAQALIEKRLADGGFVKNPHVSLSVDQKGSLGASALGQVSKPGVYPVVGPMRLFDLISVAGGLTEKAGRSATITHRNDADHPVTVELARNLEDKPASNIAIQPGDTVVVRKADIVYVVGEVGHPSGFLMDTGRLTVLQAIALAGGTTRTAKLSGTRIIHKSDSGVTETTVKLQKILAAKAPDVALEADDILFVPTSTSKLVAGRTIEAAMQAATAVSIIAIQ